MAKLLDMQRLKIRAAATRALDAASDDTWIDIPTYAQVIDSTEGAPTSGYTRERWGFLS